MDFSNVRFSSDHEWVRFDDGDTVSIGITEFAAGELGDVVYVELPAVGTEVKAGDTMGTIEAVKTVADLFAPVSGTITAINETLEDGPEQVNSSPHEDGWFVKMKLSDRTEIDALMDAAAYQEMTGK